MEHYVWLALVATLGTWFVTALGAATVVFFKSPSARALNLMLGFSAGVMIAASFWSLLQPAIQRAEAAGNTPAWLVAVSGFLLGALFLWGSDKAVCFARKRAGMGMPGERMNRIIMLVLSITLHNIPEGLAVGVAFGALGTGASPDGLMGAVSIAVGIGLQNFPEGVLPAQKLPAGAGFRSGGAGFRGDRRAAGGDGGSDPALCPCLCRRGDDSGCGT